MRFHKSNQIYARDFGRIINEDKYNEQFIKRAKTKCVAQRDIIEKEAARKSNALRNLLLTTNSKYKFLPGSEVKLLKQKGQVGIFDFLTSHKIAKEDSLKELIKLDLIATEVPIFMPEHHTKISSYYGIRKHPVDGLSKFHCGIDLIGNKATPVYSSAFGKVVRVSRSGSYGNMVDVLHSHRIRTRYAHLSRIYVKEGDSVLRGQKLGLQGRSGRVTGEHLHFEIWVNDKHVDPYDFLSNGV
jgi:murein DD-endopeptidase MepM/ murein hydrolase activator NlpD